MKCISVLMSTFNETEEQITASIESILKQDFKSFEFIIINDNPNREDLNYILEKFSLIDNRIIVVKNDKNIGLALSLNKAAAYANTEYYARMDADDISHPSRLGIQYTILKSGDYDLVFTDYTYIDEQSNPIPRSTNYWHEKDIYKYLPTKSIIHHPTVMMKKSIFDKVGGYRNFPCAQDYDLWLRLLENGCRFFMIDKKLLQYRVRQNNISKSKSYEQKITIDYIRELFIQRLKSGKDDYSYDNYIKYMHINKLKNPVEQIDFYGTILIEAMEYLKKKKYLHWLLLRIKVFIKSPVYRRSFLRTIRLKFYIMKSKYSKKHNIHAVIGSLPKNNNNYRIH